LEVFYTLEKLLNAPDGEKLCFERGNALRKNLVAIERVPISRCGEGNQGTPKIGRKFLAQPLLRDAIYFFLGEAAKVVAQVYSRKPLLKESPHAVRKMPDKIPMACEHTPATGFVNHVPQLLEGFCAIFEKVLRLID